MSLRNVFPGLVLIVVLMACTNNSELEKDMIYPGKTSAAIDEVLGFSMNESIATFRIYAPSVKQVALVLFATHDAVTGQDYPMKKKTNGVWEISLPKTNLTPFYAYRSSAVSDVFIADPYSRAVVRKNNFRYPSKSIILEDNPFEWEGDDFTHMNLGEMVILEAHMRDMSVHPSSGSQAGGTYLGFVEEDQQGGIQHLLDMGYNAVEFLPLQEFGNIEIDFQNPNLTLWNDWNPYEANHWGYMTSFFFAPEIYYGSDGVRTRDVWLGQDGRAIHELKTMVKALHQKGISVIVDVVYNHVSQYDENPFKLIDKTSYFRLDDSGDYLGHSGCGNDFKTEHPMARKMIIESLVYWMEEFHIDGFRFDLAAMIDLETIDAITAATRAVNPDVVLIGEPWGGGGYNPAELADHDWPSWNDHFRNSVKGRNPTPGDRGLIFGDLWDGNNLEHYQKLMRGYLQGEGGHYRDPVQSVNYLESHDDHTMGDFIRLALGKVSHGQVVSRADVAKLSKAELKIHKFAAFNLFTSQGPVMVAQGQSWGRSKVIANSIGSDPAAGQLDHNSYEKDDETNWLNWDEKALNTDLVDYYRGLIAIRAKYSEITDVTIGYREFIAGPTDLSYGIQLGEETRVLVLINADGNKKASFDLPEGKWKILANDTSADPNSVSEATASVAVKPLSGLLLVK